MPSVSDSSPLIYLVTLGDLDLLRLLFGDVLIPRAVYREVVESGEGLPGAADVREACGSWMRVVDAPAPSAEEIARRWSLQVGEAEALALAAQMPRAIVFLDDQDAVMGATLMDLAVVRTPSLYVTAKRNGLIKAVRPKLDALRREGFRLRDRAYHAVLEKAGE